MRSNARMMHLPSGTEAKPNLVARARGVMLVDSQIGAVFLGLWSSNTYKDRDKPIWGQLTFHVVR